MRKYQNAYLPKHTPVTTKEKNIIWIFPLKINKNILGLERSERLWQLFILHTPGLLFLNKVLLKLSLAFLHMVFTFFVTKVSHWARKCPCLNCGQELVLIWQAEHKICHFTENFVRYTSTAGWRWMSKHCNETFGWPFSFCHYSHFWSSLLTISVYSVNVISFLGLWGIWWLESCSYNLPDAGSKVW